MLSVRWCRQAGPVVLLALASSCAAPIQTPPRMDISSANLSGLNLLRYGRELTLHHGCGDCHGGYANPEAEWFLAGARTPEQEYQIGPFKTYPRNITPDNTTGIGRFTERQIFNSLRYGLRPGETPDVEITSSVPGEGNFPVSPKYLAPPMPWTAFRHMPDDDLWAIVAYLKRGVKPVNNRVPDSDGPPDFWAGEYTVEKYGAYPAVAFPGRNERMP
jgi:hypothetical protein